jgi:hypothetical protein
MASVAEALNACIDQDRVEMSARTKSQKVMKHERSLVVKRLLQFLENVDEDLSVMEVRQALEEFDTTSEVM